MIVQKTNHGLMGLNAQSVHLQNIGMQKNQSVMNVLLEGFIILIVNNANAQQTCFGLASSVLNASIRNILI